MGLPRPAGACGLGRGGRPGAGRGQHQENVLQPVQLPTIFGEVSRGKCVLCRPKRVIGLGDEVGEVGREGRGGGSRLLPRGGGRFGGGGAGGRGGGRFV